MNTPPPKRLGLKPGYAADAIRHLAELEEELSKVVADANEQQNNGFISHKTAISRSKSRPNVTDNPTYWALIAQASYMQAMCLRMDVMMRTNWAVLCFLHADPESTELTDGEALAPTPTPVPADSDSDILY